MSAVAGEGMARSFSPRSAWKDPLSLLLVSPVLSALTRCCSSSDSSSVANRRPSSMACAASSSESPGSLSYDGCHHRVPTSPD